MQVLIISDNPHSPIPRVLIEMATRSYVRLMLDTVPGLEEAIIHLQKCECRVIVLDLDHAVNEGDMEPLYRLRRFKPDVPIVVLFGARSTGLADIAMRIGAVDVVNASDLDVRGLWRAVYLAGMRQDQKENQDAVAVAFGLLTSTLQDLRRGLDALHKHIGVLDNLLERAIIDTEGSDDDT